MSDQWYYAKNGQQLGPVSTEVLTRMTGAGQVQPTGLVWREGMPNWAPARSVRGLFPEPAPTPAAYAPAPAPAPAARAPAAGEAAAYHLNPEPVVVPAPAREPAPERAY